MSTSRRPHGRATPAGLGASGSWGVCDGCGFLYDHRKLRWRREWRGRQLQNLGLLVCPTCLDKPQPNVKVLILPPDPEPVLDARPEPYAIDEA